MTQKWRKIRLAKETSRAGFRDANFKVSPRCARASFYLGDAPARLRLSLVFLLLFFFFPTTAEIRSCICKLRLARSHGTRGVAEVKMEMLPRWREGRRRRTEVCRCWRERWGHRRRLFRFVMGKADTHRDAHLRLFIPRSTYNTSITGDRYSRTSCAKETLCLEGKESSRGHGERIWRESRSPEDAAKRA